MWPSQDDRGEEHQDLNKEDKTSRVRPDTDDEDGTVGDHHRRGIDNHWDWESGTKLRGNSRRRTESVQDGGDDDGRPVL